MDLRQLFPFLSWARQITGRSLRADLLAGITGTLIVLPQGVAYALIAGLPPQYGLYSALVPTVVAALFGSSHHSVTGPTAANSILVLATCGALAAPGSPAFVQIAITLAFLVGLLQLGFGLLRLGALVNFIADSVVVGFTAGAAVLIAASQLKHVFALPLADDLSFLGTLLAVAEQAPQASPYALVVAAAAFGSGLLTQWLRPRWPALLLAMAVSSLLAWGLDAASHGVRMVGALPQTLPPFSLPALEPAQLRSLAPGALALAVLALVQAISSARAVAMRSGQQLNGNREFIGQGLGNLVGSFFSAYPTSGSFTRSGANYDAGARTPLAAVVAAAGVAAVLLFAPGLTTLLALPAMGGVVLLIAWNLLDLRRTRRILRVSRRESAVLAVTFAATLLLELEFAIYAGVLLSLGLYLRRSARPGLVPLVPLPERPGMPLRNAAKHERPECRRVKILRVDGSLFFGSSASVQSALRQVSDQGYRYVLLVGSGVDQLDLTAAEMLVREARRLAQLGGGLYFSNFKDAAARLLRHPEFRDAIGPDHLHASPAEALREIFGHMQRPPCEQCPLRGALETAAPEAVGGR